MNVKLIPFILILFLINLQLSAQTPAFPTAEGYGK
mgnify:FL=1